MKTAFKNITTIQTGVFAKPIPKGEIVYLQAKHFDENGELTNTLYPLYTPVVPPTAAATATDAASNVLPTPVKP